MIAPTINPELGQHLNATRKREAQIKRDLAATPWWRFRRRQECQAALGFCEGFCQGLHAGVRDEYPSSGGNVAVHVHIDGREIATAVATAVRDATARY